MARKILLADDSVTAQNMGRRILTDAGYEVVTVNNGSAALKKIAESKPDLVILDVYMPGYGGLEVCQRLKEAKETGRIPVLLSVGKLEPFKVEESRRVHADGFIIKPFEASELLTALTKLEDKIVPQAESYKGSRFAKAIAAAEQAGTTQGIGEDTGWQNRLTIPRGTLRPEEEEVAVGKQDLRPASAGLRDTAQREESKLVAMKAAEAAALPHGITVEELAAIAAAATTFSDKSDSGAAPIVEPEIAAAQKTESPAEGKAEASLGEVLEAVTFGSTPAMQGPAFQNEVPNPLQTPAQAAELQRATTDAEVLAALASLSPTHMESPAAAVESANSNGDKAGAHHGADAAVTVEASTTDRAETRANGPRWIAQAVAIADDESTLILEREMEKAYAAMTSLEADKASATEAATSAEPVFSQSRSEEPAQGVPERAAAPVPETVASASVPEVSTPEAAATPETSSAATESVTAVSETNVPVTSENAAYAAAASAGTGISEASAPAESSSAVPSATQSAAATPAESDPGRESELAAAWQNWKQIRESMVGSSSAVPKAEAATPAVEASAPVETGTPGFKEILREEPVTAKPDEETASEDSGETSEISSIVDTMLAELKPKLMEEISKKMGKEKKRKK